jgi:hypothetical protein
VVIKDIAKKYGYNDTFVRKVYKYSIGHKNVSSYSKDIVGDELDKLIGFLQQYTHLKNKASVQYSQEILEIIVTYFPEAIEMSDYQFSEFLKAVERVISTILSDVEKFCRSL